MYSQMISHQRIFRPVVFSAHILRLLTAFGILTTPNQTLSELLIFFYDNYCLLIRRKRGNLLPKFSLTKLRGKRGVSEEAGNRVVEKVVEKDLCAASAYV